MQTKNTSETSPSQALKLIEGLTGDACRSLFSAYAVDLHDVAERSTPTLPVLLSSVVGFSGPGLRGTCILAASERPILATMPAGGTMRDWIAELSNQLVGRLKNKLVSRGIEVYVTTPVVLRGEHLAPMPRNHLPPLAFRGADGNVFVWIELETAPGFELGTVSNAAAVVPEGGAVFF
jgi:CheY-specific phosphatase CheX